MFIIATVRGMLYMYESIRPLYDLTMSQSIRKVLRADYEQSEGAYGR